jgi:hypothetical protein
LYVVSERYEKQVKSGGYAKISGDYFKGANKRQRIWVKLRRGQTQAIKNSHLEVVDGQPKTKFLEGNLVHRESSPSLEPMAYPPLPAGDQNVPNIVAQIFYPRKKPSRDFTIR